MQMWLSDLVDQAIEAAIADCTTIADISAMKRDLSERHPELRLNIDELVEVLVARATAKGLAVRFDDTAAKEG